MEEAGNSVHSRRRTKHGAAAAFWRQQWAHQVRPLLCALAAMYQHSTNTKQRITFSLTDLKSDAKSSTILD
jgi:hypothetical protein